MKRALAEITIIAAVCSLAAWGIISAGLLLRSGVLSDRFEAEIAASQRETLHLGEALERAEAQLADSQEALRRAIERGREAERIAGELGGVIDSLTDGAAGIESLIRELVDEIGAIVSGLSSVPENDGEASVGVENRDGSGNDLGTIRMDVR